jgi:hypothetical protein
VIKDNKAKARNTAMVLFCHAGGVGGVQQFYLGPRDMDIPDTQVS